MIKLMKINKYSVLTVNAFLISPLLSIPLISYLLSKHRDSLAIILISTLSGFLSMKYIPNYSDDKTRYIERYNLFIDYSFEDFVAYLGATLRPDFIFDLLNFIFAKLDIDLRFFFGFITTSTVYLILYTVKKMNSEILSKRFSYNNLTIAVILLSLSIPNLLSGIRFYFAGSIFLCLIYYFFFKKKYAFSITLALLTLSTHFSYLLLLVAMIPVLLFNNAKHFKYFLGIGLILILLPKDISYNLISSLPLPTNYLNKVDGYINIDREFSNAFLFLQKLKESWYYISCLFLLLYKPKGRDIYYRLISSLFIFVNLTFNVPYAFGRYLTLLKLIFAAYIIRLLIQKRIKPYIFNLFIMVFLVSWFIDIYIMRYNFDYSYSLANMWSLYHMLFENSNLYNYLN